MGRMIKLIPVLVLVMGLPLALLACGGDESSESSAADQAATSPATEGSVAASEPAATESTSTEKSESITTSGSTSAETDREALIALYNATDGANWTNNENWLSGNPLGEWYGVTTDSLGSVVGLDLSQNGLSGEIPAGLGQLSNLFDLSLGGNQLSGGIPADLGQLANLVRLRLAGNDLSGCVPDTLRGVSYNDFDELGLPFCTPDP